MEKLFKKRINGLKKIINMPSAYTAAAILIAYNTDDKLLQPGIFFALLLIIVIRRNESRIPTVYALIMFLISAFLLAFQVETAANKTAILGYYLLCAGVIAQFIEYIRNPEVDDHKNE